MKNFLMLFLMLLMGVSGFSQNGMAVYDDQLIFLTGDGVKTAVAVNPLGNAAIGVTDPDSSAILDLTSTTMGLGLPVLTTTEVNAISSPRIGLAVFNSTDSILVFYNGSGWRKVTDAEM